MCSLRYAVIRSLHSRDDPISNRVSDLAGIEMPHTIRSSKEDTSSDQHFAQKPRAQRAQAMTDASTVVIADDVEALRVCEGRSHAMSR